MEETGASCQTFQPGEYFSGYVYYSISVQAHTIKEIPLLLPNRPGSTGGQGWPVPPNQELGHPGPTPNHSAPDFERGCSLQSCEVQLPLSRCNLGIIGLEIRSNNTLTLPIMLSLHPLDRPRWSWTRCCVGRKSDVCQIHVFGLKVTVS